MSSGLLPIHPLLRKVRQLPLRVVHHLLENGLEFLGLLRCALDAGNLSEPFALHLKNQAVPRQLTVGPQP